MQVSPTPDRGPTLRMPGANRTSCSASVVSLHRDGLLCIPAPGLLQPGTGHGVHCVSASREPESLDESSALVHREASPQRGSYPSTNSPRQQPYRITAAVALLWLPPGPCPRPHALRRRRFVQPSAPAGNPTSAAHPGRSRCERGEPPRYSHSRRRSAAHHCAKKPRVPAEAGAHRLFSKASSTQNRGYPALLAARRRRELVPLWPKPPRPVLRRRSTAPCKSLREPPDPCRQHDFRHRKRRAEAPRVDTTGRNL